MTDSNEFVTPEDIDKAMKATVSDDETVTVVLDPYAMYVKVDFNENSKTMISGNSINSITKPFTVYDLMKITPGYDHPSLVSETLPGPSMTQRVISNNLLSMSTTELNMYHLELNSRVNSGCTLDDNLRLQVLYYLRLEKFNPSKERKDRLDKLKALSTELNQTGEYGSPSFIESFQAALNELPDNSACTLDEFLDTNKHRE